MKRILSALLLGLGFLASAPAHAACTVNTVPSVGLICDLARNPTYSATSIGLVPAASATDFFCISGSTSKTISIRQIILGGTAGTAIQTPVIIYQRSALGTGGTAATSLAAPVAVPFNSTDPAATAVLVAYTANPSVAATPIVMDAVTLDLPVTTAAGGATEVMRNYGTQVDFLSKGLDIVKGSTVQYCLNLNGVSVSSGVLNVNIQWQEN